MRGVSPEDAAIDLVIEDGTRVSTIYFLMSDDNLRKQIALPYVSFGSDADSSAPPSRAPNTSHSGPGPEAHATTPAPSTDCAAVANSASSALFRLCWKVFPV